MPHYANVSQIYTPAQTLLSSAVTSLRAGFLICKIRGNKSRLARAVKRPNKGSPLV